jgi:hypothetical protein
MSKKVFEWEFTSKYDRFKFNIDPSERYVLVGDHTNRVNVFDLVRGGKLTSYGPFGDKQLVLIASRTWQVPNDSEGEPVDDDGVEEWGFFGVHENSVAFFSAQASK